MEMKKVACAVIFAAASVSAVLAAESSVSPVADTPAAAVGTPGSAPIAYPASAAAVGTPGSAPIAYPASAAASTTPFVVGASLMSVVAYFLQ